MSGNHNFLIYGYYGSRNLGDDMMLYSLHDWLSMQGVSITVLSEDPAQIRTQFGFPTVENVPLLGEWDWKASWLKGKAIKLIREFRRFDGLIVGGGDLIRDDRGIKAFAFSLEKVALAQFLRKPVYLLNVGIGEPHRWYTRLILKHLLNRCQQIVVRDRRSLRLCESLGAGRITTYAHDIVLSAPESLLVPAERPLPRSPRPYVAVCLRDAAGVYGYFHFSDERIRTLAAALDRVVEEQGVDIRFVPFCSCEQADDGRLHARVATQMRNAGRVVVREWTGDVASVCEDLRQSRCVIAMRLHAAVLAVALCRQCVVIPYDIKVFEFAGEMKLPWILNADSVDDPDRIVRVITSALLAPAPPPVEEAQSWRALRLRNHPPKANRPSVTGAVSSHPET